MWVNLCFKKRFWARAEIHQLLTAKGFQSFLFGQNKLVVYILINLFQ